MRIPTYSGKLPYLTMKQMIEVDRAMIQDFHIDLIQMMENAGRNLAHLARERFLGGDPNGKEIVILAGTGGNGGGALVCARRLANYGASVNVLITKPDDSFTPIPAHQLDIVRRLGISVTNTAPRPASARQALIIDGLIGYSLKGAPHGRSADLIRWANEQQSPILALDVPSGISTTTGTVFTPAIKAGATMTLALPKEGLRTEGVAEHVGELYLADIGVPPGLYQQPPLSLHLDPIFAESDILRIN